MMPTLKLSLAGLFLCCVSCHIAFGQEPAQQTPEAAQESPSGTFVLQPEVNGALELVLDPSPTLTVDGASLNLTTLTYGNPFGVDVAAIDDTLRAQLGIAEGTGVVVTNVAGESEAAKAGLKTHDIVLQINDQPVASPEGFNETVGKEQGHEVRLGLIRQGQPLGIKVALPSTPQYELHFTTQLANDGLVSGQHYRIGVTLAEADDTLRSQLRLAAGEGLVVTEVVSDGPAATAGIKPHDVLTKLDGKRLSTVENINAQIQEIGARQVALDYIRAGEERSSDVTPQLSQDATTPLGVRLWDLSGRQTANSLLSRAAVRWLNAAEVIESENAVPAASTDVPGQIEELKRKLADIAQSLEALGAALQPPPAQELKPADEPQPEDSKPE